MARQNRKDGGAMGRYVLRHILRSLGKSLLALALAAIFMLGLMVIQVSTLRSENELERLYATTTVTMEIMKGSSAQVITDGVSDSGFVYPRTVDKLTDTGFLSHRYVEASVEDTVLTRLDADGEEIGLGLHNAALYGVEYPQEFLAQRNVEGMVTYFDGWDESVFRQSWQDFQGRASAAYPVYPVVVSQALYEFLEMKEGELLRAEITARTSALSLNTEVYATSLTVIGTHPGELTTALLPVESFRKMTGVDMKYDRVVLTIDPAKNRRLDEFRVQAAELLSGGGTVPITAIYWDQELRQAIAPMEQVISLMKTLYPVTLGLSLIVAAGISVLLSLLSAKEAAIMRVLGNSKARCRAVLCLQIILVCVAGLLAGHLGAVAMAYVMLPPGDAAGLMLPALGRVGLYLLAAALGAVGASVAMTARNPLELLQVKE